MINTMKNKLKYTLTHKKYCPWLGVHFNGRDELPIPEKVELDVEYMERKSFWFDLYIFWLTVIKVVRRDGITHWRKIYTIN